MNLFRSTLCLAATAFAAASASAAPTQLHYTFDDLSVGGFDASDLNPAPSLAHKESNGYVASWGGDKHLKVNYDANVAGVANGSGLRFFTDLHPRDQYFFSYKVRFEPGFEWVEGGKLPGLAGGDSAAGGRPADGDGWTARKMWKQGGELVPYVYHMDKPGDFGHTMGGTDEFFQTGRWYQITSRVKLNTGNNKNGIYQLWLDGDLIEDRRNIRYRNNDQALIDSFHFETFFGGSGPSASPSSAQTVRFDDVRVGTTLAFAANGAVATGSIIILPEPALAELVVPAALLLVRRRGA